jgi:hypothetical protein
LLRRAKKDGHQAILISLKGNAMSRLKTSPFLPTETSAQSQAGNAQSTDWLGERIERSEPAPSEGVALPIKQGAEDKGQAVESRRGSHN